MRRTSKKFQVKYEIALSEYEELGEQLKHTTRKKIAEKFEIDHHALAGLVRLNVDDFELIKALIDDRMKIIAKRAKLRTYLHP